MTVPDQDWLPVEPAKSPVEDRPERPAVPMMVFLAIGGGSTVLLGYLARRVFLFWDDYLFLGEANKASWSASYLGDGLFQHFSPVTRGINLAVVGVLPGRPAVIWLFLMLCAAALVAASTTLMVALFGRSWVAATGAVLLGPALSLLPLVNWWTAGINILPSLAGSALCLAGVVFLVRGRSRWWGVAAAAGYLVAVLDWESAMLMAGYALAWVVLFRARVTPESLRQVLRRTWWLWALLIVIGAASLVNYRLNYYLPAPPAPLGDVFQGLRISLFNTMIPSLLGFHDPATGWFSVLGTLVGGLALLWLLLVTLVRRIGAWRGWLFAVAGWLLPSAALVLNRVGYWGPVVAENVIYFYLPTLLFLVGVLEAWVAPSRSTRAEHGRPTFTRDRVLAGAAIIVIALAYLRSADSTIASRIPYGADPNFVPTAAAAAAAIEQPYSIINGDVSEGLVPEVFAPYNRVSNVLGLNIPGIVFDSVTGPYYVAGPMGALDPVAISWLAEIPASLNGANPLVVEGGTDLRYDPGHGVCFTAAADTPARINLALPAPVSGDRLVVGTRVTVDQQSVERLQTAPTATGELTIANGDSNQWMPELSGRLDTVTAPAPAPALTTIDHLRLDRFTAGTAVCISSISIGNVVPAS